MIKDTRVSAAVWGLQLKPQSWMVSVVDMKRFLIWLVSKTCLQIVLQHWVCVRVAMKYLSVQLGDYVYLRVLAQ